MARSPSKRRKRRGEAGNNTNQLSFFDPAGELNSLLGEQRELARQKDQRADHRRSLIEAAERAESQLELAEQELQQLRNDAERVMSVSGTPFELTLSARNSVQTFTDKMLAGVALLNELGLQAERSVGDNNITGLGQMAGLELCVTFARRDDNESVFSPVLQRLDGTFSWSSESGAEFTLNDQPDIIIEHFEAVLAAIPKSVDEWSEFVAKSRAEAADYRHQLDALPQESDARLSEVSRRITSIQSADGGLFQTQATKPTQTEGTDHVTDKRADGPSEKPLSRSAGNVPPRELPRGIRQNASSGEIGGLSGRSRGESGGYVQADRRSDDHAGEADGRDGQAELSEQRGTGGGRNSSERYRQSAAIKAEEERRRERARKNFRLLPEHSIGGGTPKAKVAGNIAAIKIVKALAEDDRPATDEEKVSLARYVGWGAFAQAIFDPRPHASNANIWREERRALADLLTEEEWSAARASTLNAHYTSEAVIRGIWSAIEHMGFKGGRAIEPALGVGHFIGLTPDNLREQIAWTGVEIDPTSGAIAKALYPGSDIRIAPFQSVSWPDGFFDLAISNVPFGNYLIRDRHYSPMAIHDYFFVRGLDKVRAGGVAAFITSRYTLDKQSTTVRREIARRAEFLGAIRLPGGKNGAFAGNAGTSVTTDIIFLRRRDRPQTQGQENWLSLVDIETPEGPTQINRYFADHPEMMLGEMRLTGSMYSDAEPVLVGQADGLEQQIAGAAIQNLPANILNSQPTLKRKDELPQIDAGIGSEEIDGRRVKEGAFYIRGGTIYRRIEGVGVEQTGISRANQARLTSLIQIRDIVNELLERQARGDLEDRSALRARLNLTYDAFHRRYGPINRTLVTETARLRKDGTPVTLRKMPNFGLFRDDPDAFKVAAIEAYDQSKDVATKAAIFSHDIVQPLQRPVISAPGDALALSLNETGQVDPRLIASQLDVEPDEAIEMLGEQVWLDPAGEIWRTRQDYLSGDVVRKLEDARVAAETDQRYERNITALESVQPVPLTRVDINVLCGAPWIPLADYQAFFAEKFKIDAAGLRYSEVTQKWQFTTRPAIPASTQSEYGTSRSSAQDILLAALNNTEIRIHDRSDNDTPVYNPKASEESNTKVAQIRELFSGSADDPEAGWIWENDDRAARLEELYNQAFNRLVPTAYDGSHLTFPGMVRFIRAESGQIIPFALRPHQRDAVWRTMASGNTLLDHAVGAGKTFAMIASGMEQKRLGLIARPLYVVPNHMLEQFSREFLQAYPGAKILVADKASMARDRRREFAARVASDNWDGVIITHDAFGRIRMSDEAYETFIQKELDGLRDFKMNAAEEEGSQSPTVKDLERAVKQAEARLERLVNQERKDDGVTFEQLGIDFLFVDEAHLFKNLAFRTRHTRVKGLAATDSQRSTDLFMKIQYLEEGRPGRTAVFATGTPISNTIAEMYTMQRYLQMPLLQEYGIDNFDAWVGTFGDIVSQIELAPNGRDFRTVRSFSRFVNIPELISLYSLMADTQTAETLQLPRPKLKTGQVQLVEAELSEQETMMMDALVARAEAIKGRKAEKGADNILKIMTEGLQLATDARILDPDAPFNPNGKIAKAVDNIHRIWLEGKDPALSQMVFLDSGVPGSRTARKTASSDTKGSDDDLAIIPASDDLQADDQPVSIAGQFNLYDDLRARLVERGIPHKQIAFIHDANSDDRKGQLFAAVRRGDIRVLIGSTSKMGMGTNVQERLTAMHHLDAPWRPADVEQRDGRIIRQGNRNEEVSVYRYVTKKTLDAYRWQILATKAAFIAQIRAGARGVRSAGDIDSPLPEAAMIKAAATGDPRIMEHAEISKEVRVLEAGLRAYERSIAAAKTALTKTKQTIELLKTQTVSVKADIGRMADLSGDAFAATLRFEGEDRPKQLTGRKAAGERLKAQLLHKGAKLWDKQTVESCGQLSGFEIQIGLSRQRGALKFMPLLKGELTYSRGEWFSLSEDTDALGLMRRFESLLKGIPKFAEEVNEKLAKAVEDLPRLESRIDAPAFAKQDQLDKARARMLELESVLHRDQERGGNDMKQGKRLADWDQLDEATRKKVRKVIAGALESGQRHSQKYESGEIIAEPRSGGKVAWSIHSMARDVTVFQGEVDSVEQQDTYSKAIFELTRQLAAATGETPVRSEVINDGQEAGLAALNGISEQSINKMEGWASLVARLEPHEFKEVQGLANASRNEADFHEVYSRIRDNPQHTAESLSRIASAYTGTQQQTDDRNAALGTIETRFYQSRTPPVQERQKAGRRVSA